MHSGFFTQEREYAFVPHLTIGQGLSDAEHADVLGRLRMKDFYYEQPIDRFHLLYQLENGTWTVHETFRLERGTTNLHAQIVQTDEQLRDAFSVRKQVFVKEQQVLPKKSMMSLKKLPYTSLYMIMMFPLVLGVFAPLME